MDIPSRRLTAAAPHEVRAWPEGLSAMSVAVYAAIALAVLVRAVPILHADFPLNDGGLFYRMTEEIQAAHYRMPPWTTYNNGGIPFAYSPLAFYVAAAINSLTGISLLQLFRFLPLVATCLAVIAFYRLACSMLRDARTAVVAVFAFAIVPRSSVWLLMGGGLTRAMGFLFAIIALQQVYELYRRRQWRYAATTTVACTLTVLSHLSTASFLAFSIVLFFLFYGRHWYGLVSSIAIAVGTVLLTAPWWGVVVAAHGFAPFLAARTVNGSVFSDPAIRNHVLGRLARLNTTITGEPLLPVVALLAVLGALASLRPDRLILPVWWVVITVLDWRAGPTYATLPLALLAGIGVIDVLLPALRTAYGAVSPVRTDAPQARATPSGGPPDGASWLRFAPAVVLGALLVYGLGSALTHNPDYGGEASVLTALTRADRDAMQWAAQHTPPSTRFLVITGEPWYMDKVGEWFPALANRTSVSTVQGTEWLPGFNQRSHQTDQVQLRCRTEDADCIRAWTESSGRPFDDVYVVKDGNGSDEDCCLRLAAVLRGDPEYAVLYDGPGALIATRR